MRIAMIAPPWVPVPPPAYGGIEAVVETLASGLVEAGHEVLLIATGDSRSKVPVAYLFEEALGVGRADATVMELLHVMSAYELATSFDIVHDHTIVGPAYSARYPELPVVTTNHGPFDFGLQRYYEMVSNRVPVIAISHSQALGAKGSNVIDVIHHGVDLNEYQLGRGDGGYALFLGRMNPDKGVHSAIKVAREAGVPLRIAAKCREDSEKAYFEDVIRPMLGDGVEYLGEANKEEKRELLAGATCLLNPIAWQEPFGMVMLEALASGTPVVATHCGSAPEIVIEGETGYLSDSFDGLVAGVKSASELDRHSCRNLVEQRFSKEIMVRNHIEVYEKVIANFGALGFSKRASKTTPKAKGAPDRGCNSEPQNLDTAVGI